MKKLLSILCLLAALTACSSDDSTGNDRPATMTEGRTVLIYMAAENSLSPHVANSLEQIKAGSRLIGSGNTLLVYVDRSEPKELPWLARIRDGVVTDSASLSDMGISQQNEYASDPQLMVSVLKYAFSHHPAKHDYGLVLWGHSTGWLVDPDTIAYKRAYGVDNGHNDRSDVGKWVNLPTLARVLGKQPHLKFIFADCCNFMCLESLYELRTVTDYIIGSPAEIPGVGAPYQQVVPAMFGASDDFCRDVAANYYARPVNGRTLPMTVVQTSALPELAQATRRVLTTIGNRLAGSYADLTGLIHYYNSGAVFSPDYNIFYDAGDFIAKHAPASDYQSWQQALSRAVVCKFYAPMWNTDKPWSSFYADFTATESRCHGLSMFVPQDPARGSYARYNRDIKQLQWYYAAGLDAIAH